MDNYHFKLVLGTHLPPQELDAAAELLSRAYSRWQTDPRNRAPVETDTSPAVYVEMMCKGSREAVLYYEEDRLCGVFVHSLSPDYDQHPLRKLSYLAVFPTEHGYEALRAAFVRYAAFAGEQGEDVIISSDLDQTTLNSLLEQAGFREVTARNETYFLLSRLLRHQVLAAQQVEGDFVIDQVITLDGKAIRRSKKLYRLQTTPYDAYAIYYQQQIKRMRRSVPPQNLALLQAALCHQAQGIYFVSDFEGAISLEDEADGSFDVMRALMGRRADRLLSEIVDNQANLVYLLPGSEDELGKIADRIVFRPGFFDFLCFCFKVLGSFFVTSSVVSSLVRQALERPLSPGVPLHYLDLIEDVLAPQAHLLPDELKPLSDGTLRVAYRYEGPYVDFSSGQYHIKKDAMIGTVLGYKGDTPAPLVYLGHSGASAPAVARLFAESERRCMPVVVFDLGAYLTTWANANLVNQASGSNPYFSIISVRDFYQVPVMLEGMGLQIEAGIDLAL